MRLLILIIFILATKILTAQEYSSYYTGVPSDSIGGGQLRFYDDSTIELSSFPRHMSQSVSLRFRYIKDSSCITVLTNKLSSSDTSKLKYFGLNVPSTKLTLIENGLINEKSSIIYFRQRSNSNTLNVTYIIDGKTYIDELGNTNAYGLISKEPKRNKKLQKKLSRINTSLEEFNIQVYKGLDAYKRFKMEGVSHVFVITTKS